MALRRPTISLGTIPWTEETLIEAFWQDFQGTRQIVDAHPGRKIDRHLQSLEAVLDMFFESAQQIQQTLRIFCEEAEEGSLMRRPRRKDLESYGKRIRHLLYMYSTSAMTLVDQSRTIDRQLIIPGYDEKVAANFKEDRRHRFIQEFRNDSVHLKLHRPGWQIALVFGEGRIGRFLLPIDQLERLGDYHSLAKEFVKANPRGIDVGELVAEYTSQVKAFHAWFKDAIAMVGAEQIADYHRCINTLNRLSSKSSWNLIFQQIVIPRGIDPSTRLDEYLTREELSLVNALEPKSKQQVDKIIQFVDEFGACDEALRLLVYKAFGVNDDCGPYVE